MRHDSISIADNSMQKALEELWEKYKNEFRTEVSDKAKDLEKFLTKGWFGPRTILKRLKFS